MKSRQPIPELDGRLVVTHATAARLLGFGITAYYQNLKDGSLPLKIRRIGKKDKVLVSSIYEVLGI